MGRYVQEHGDDEGGKGAKKGQNRRQYLLAVRIEYTGFHVRAGHHVWKDEVPTEGQEDKKTTFTTRE